MARIFDQMYALTSSEAPKWCQVCQASEETKIEKRRSRWRQPGGVFTKEQKKQRSWRELYSNFMPESLVKTSIESL
jgi:hypothetical protein